MFVIAPKQNPSHLTSINSVQKSEFNAAPSASFNKLVLLQAVVESLIDGVVLVSEQGDVFQFNELARQICHRLNAQSSSDITANQSIKSGNSAKSSSAKSSNLSDLHALPHEVWRVCQALLDSDRLFLNQKTILELEVMLVDQSMVRIRAQKFDWTSDPDEQADDFSRCILVTLEDRHQASQYRAIADTLKFNLTPREGQIWQLRLQGCSYRAIAARLYITENTVKKHVKNILAKRQFVLVQEAEAN